MICILSGYWHGLLCWTWHWFLDFGFEGAKVFEGPGFEGGLKYDLDPIAKEAEALLGRPIRAFIEKHDETGDRFGAFEGFGLAGTSPVKDGVEELNSGRCLEERVASEIAAKAGECANGIVR